MEMPGHRPYPLTVIELTLGFLISSLTIPSLDLETRLTLSATLGSAVGGLLFYVGPFERVILPGALRTLFEKGRDYTSFLSTSYMTNTVTYVAGGWYACTAIGLLAFFPPLILSKYVSISLYQFCLGIVIFSIFVASVLEFKTVPMKLKLIEHYESLIRYSRDPQLLEQTFGASLTRGDFQQDAKNWSRRWAVGEEYVRLRPLLFNARYILATTYSDLILEEYQEGFTDLEKFRALVRDQVERTQLSTDFITGGYGELLRDFSMIAKAVGDMQSTLRASRKDLPFTIERAIDKKAPKQVIKRVVLEIGALIEDETWERL